MTPLPAKNRVESIHLLRALAASLVVVYHACNSVRSLPNASPLLSSSPLTELGAAGVDVFFVISGFVMVMTLANPAHRMQGGLKFFQRRAMRVVPMYWLGTTAMVLLWLLPGAFSHNPHPASHIVESYLFIPYYSVSGRIEPILTPGWTLMYEMYFYTIIAICITRSLRSIIIACTGVLLTLVFAGLVFAPHGAVPAFGTGSLLLEFVMGLFAGAVYIRSKPLPILVTCALIILAAVLWSADLFVELRPQWRAIMWGVPAMVLVLAATSYEKHRQVRLPKFVSILGDASYSIYITHIFFGLMIEIAAKRLPMAELPNSIVALIMCIGNSLLFGIACHYWIERPITARLWAWSERRPVRARSCSLAPSSIDSESMEPAGAMA